MPEGSTHGSSGFTRVATLEALATEQAGPVFTGRTGRVPWPKAYGGDLVVQAAVAAMRSVADDRTMHSMHSYFLRPADVESEMRYEVDRLRDGRGYSARQVRGVQHGELVFLSMVSFAVGESGGSMADAMPLGLPAPESLPSSAELLANRTGGTMTSDSREYWKWGRSFDLRHVPDPVYQDDEGRDRTAHQAVWVRPFSPLQSVAGLDDAQRDLAAIAYVCDYTILEPLLRALGLSWSRPGLSTASLDHAIWFHRAPSPGDLDGWVLYLHDGLAAEQGRGTARGRFFSRSGVHLATVVQEGLIRTTELFTGRNP